MHSVLINYSDCACIKIHLVLSDLLDQDQSYYACIYFEIRTKNLPLGRIPICIERASMISFGIRKQNAMIRWNSEAVGPQCCHIRWQPFLLAKTTPFWASAVHVLKLRPNLKPSLAKLPTLNNAELKKNGISRTEKLVSPMHVCNSYWNVVESVAFSWSTKSANVGTEKRDFGPKRVPFALRIFQHV